MSVSNYSQYLFFSIICLVTFLHQMEKILPPKSANFVLRKLLLNWDDYVDQF